MNPHECTIDLPERQRRARFSDNEQRALEAHFAVCASCRTAHQILTDFEDLATVDSQDGARIERLAALARARVARAPAVIAVARPITRKTQLVRALGVAAALALFVGSALASERWRHARPEPKPVSATRGRGTPSALGALPAEPSPAAPGSANGPASESAASASVVSIPSHAPDPASAALLLRQAGDAVRRGDRDPAALLYQKLQAQYPASGEALVSHVSLGRLFAERGQPRAAVREFDRYLSAAHGGVLIPEALYGRARALTGLGDRADEARTWAQLLRDFPDSAYADRARRRLTELE